MKKIFAAAVALFAFYLPMSFANAQALTVIGASQDAAEREINLSELEALPQTRFRTSTIWTEGENEFEGVLLRDFLAAMGGEPQDVILTALNDYTVEVPVSDAVKGGPIIAYRINGEPISVRDKGPFWLVYPYDNRPEYRSETIYSRSIWQIAQIELR